MAQAKRKRRSKHRGTAAGVVEARGRTSRPPSPDERKRQSREQAREKRLMTAPTWRSAVRRAALASGFMAIFLLIINKGSLTTKLAGALIVAVIAFALYAPSGYYFEMWMYRRRMAKRGTPAGR